MSIVISCLDTTIDLFERVLKKQENKVELTQNSVNFSNEDVNWYTFTSHDCKKC